MSRQSIKMNKEILTWKISKLEKNHGKIILWILVITITYITIASYIDTIVMN